MPRRPGIKSEKVLLPLQKKVLQFLFQIFFSTQQFFLAKPNIGQHKGPIGRAAAGRVVPAQGPPRGGPGLARRGVSYVPKAFSLHVTILKEPTYVPAWLLSNEFLPLGPKHGAHASVKPWCVFLHVCCVLAHPLACTHARNMMPSTQNNCPHWPAPQMVS